MVQDMNMCKWGVSSSDLFLCLPFFDVLVYVQNKRADSWILRGLLGMNNPFIWSDHSPFTAVMPKWG